jgi:hypothetical protein
MKVRTVEMPSVLRQNFYACEECGKEYSRASYAESCEQKHRRDRCPHSAEDRRWVPDSDGGSLDQTCAACGLWFDECVRLDNLPDDQEVLARLVAAIREAQSRHPLLTATA